MSVSVGLKKNGEVKRVAVQCTKTKAKRVSKLWSLQYCVCHWVVENEKHVGPFCLIGGRLLSANQSIYSTGATAYCVVAAVFVGHRVHVQNYGTVREVGKGCNAGRVSI